MDLSLLRDSLPPSNLAQADRDLLDNFKAAALSVTTLYKSSLKASKQAYNEGYAACLRDVLGFVQAGVSAEGRMAELGGHDGSGALGLNLNFDVDGDGMTIGRVMDWVENRLESITAEEEDAEGEEDDDKAKARTGKAKVVAPIAPQPTTVRKPAVVPTPAAAAAPAPPVPTPGPPTTESDNQPQPTPRHSSMLPPSSSPTSSRTSHSQTPSSTLTRSRSKAERHRPTINTSASAPTFIRPPLDDIFGPESGFDFVSETPQSLLGSKRRHAAMVSEITNNHSPTTANTPTNGSGAPMSASARRRLRGSLISGGGSRPGGISDPDSMMDVEEAAEPARKRVARR